MQILFWHEIFGDAMAHLEALGDSGAISYRQNPRVEKRETAGRKMFAIVIDGPAIDTVEIAGFDTQADFDTALAKWETEQAGKSNPFLDEIKAKH